MTVRPPIAECQYKSMAMFGVLVAIHQHDMEFKWTNIIALSDTINTRMLVNVISFLLTHISDT
jgi:hypothetical protein